MLARKVSLFRNGRNQAVRIPREFELPGTEALLRREGDRLVLEPMKEMSLLEYLDQMEPLDEEWTKIDRLPPRPVNL